MAYETTTTRITRRNHTELQKLSQFYGVETYDDVIAILLKEHDEVNR